jgi:hypothetical protein
VGSLATVAATAAATASADGRVKQRKSTNHVFSASTLQSNPRVVERKHFSRHLIEQAYSTPKTTDCVLLVCNLCIELCRFHIGDGWPAALSIKQ